MLTEIKTYLKESYLIGSSFYEVRRNIIIILLAQYSQKIKKKYFSDSLD